MSSATISTLALTSAPTDEIPAHASYARVDGSAADAVRRVADGTTVGRRCSAQEVAALR
jgi:hypothetical protein